VRKGAQYGERYRPGNTGQFNSHGGQRITDSRYQCSEAGSSSY
jgi:hypothetical protein